MNKQNIAVNVSVVLLLLFVVTIGATLNGFKVSKEKVEVKQILVYASDGVTIADKKGNILSNLKVKSASVGVRPATGDEDIETDIPSTINDTIGTEGAYGCFKLTVNGDYEILLDSCSLTKGEDENLDNVKIAVMDDHAKALSGNQVGAQLFSGSSANEKDMIIVVWLDEATKKSIAGADITVGIKINKL